MRNDWRHRRAVAQAEREQVDRDRRALQRLTLHEASHAAVCFALGVPFGRVAVWWDDTFRQRGVVELKDIESADQKNVLVVRATPPSCCSGRTRAGRSRSARTATFDLARGLARRCLF